MSLKYVFSGLSDRKEVVIEDGGSNDVTIRFNSTEEEALITTYCEQEGSEIMYEIISKKDLVTLLANIAIDLGLADEVRMSILNIQIDKAIKAIEEETL